MFDDKGRLERGRERENPHDIFSSWSKLDEPIMIGCSAHITMYQVCSLSKTHSPRILSDIYIYICFISSSIPPIVFRPQRRFCPNLEHRYIITKLRFLQNLSTPSDTSHKGSTFSQKLIYLIERERVIQFCAHFSNPNILYQC